jgi:hypothetical protein
LKVPNREDAASLSGMIFSAPASVPLEILHFTLVLFGLLDGCESAKVAAFAGRGVSLS